MKDSDYQHVLAQLRLSLGFSRQEMGQLLDCSHYLVQSVELGRVPFSGTMLARAVDVMGVSGDWLAANDHSHPPVNLFGEEYTSEFFEKWRKGQVSTPETISNVRRAGNWFGYYEKGRRVLEKLDQREAVKMWVKVASFFESLEREFLGKAGDCSPGYDEQTLDLVAKDLETTRELDKIKLRGPQDMTKVTLQKLEDVDRQLKKHLRGGGR